MGPAESLAGQHSPDDQTEFTAADMPSGQAAPEDLHCILDEDRPAGNICLYTNEDKTGLYVRLTHTDSPERFSIEDIAFIAQGNDLRVEIDRPALEQLLAALTPGTTSEPVLIASGRAAGAGTDAACEILFDREKPFVHSGALLLRVRASQPGQAGETIYGDPIPPPAGQLPMVQAGEHVSERNPGEFYSETLGRVSFEHNRLSVVKTLSITVSDDRLSATMSYAGPLALTREIIATELQKLKITHGIDNAAIGQAVSAFAAFGKPIEHLPVARGTPPAPGTDGRITYYFEHPAGPSFEEHKDGSIDIRETHVAVSIDESAEIAMVTTPVEPTAGRDIFGNVLPVAKVSPVHLTAGKNVTVSEDGLHFYAQTCGRPIIEQTGQGFKLSISETFVIPGNLDLSIGNIDFKGSIEVSGDIGDGFKVCATKNITVKGAVGDCEIEAGRNIHIYGGCSGKKHASIICGGDLAVHYLSGITVKAQGTVTVDNGVLNSNVFARGRVIVKPQGAIIGGTITAKQGIEAYDVGSEMGVSTVLIPGVDFEAESKLARIEAKLAELNRKYTDVSLRIAPLLKNKELLPKLPEEQKTRLRETIQFLDKVRNRKKILTEAHEALLSDDGPDRSHEVIVKHFIFPGTLVRITKARREMSSRLEGPLRLYLERDSISVEPI